MIINLNIVFNIIYTFFIPAGDNKVHTKRLSILPKSLILLNTKFNLPLILKISHNTPRCFSFQIFLILWYAQVRVSFLKLDCMTTRLICLINQFSCMIFRTIVIDSNFSNYINFLHNPNLYLVIIL